MSQSRSILRKHIRLLRQNLSAQQQEAAQQDLVKVAKDALKSQDLTGQKIAIYLANDGELNPQGLLDFLLTQKAEVFLPVLHPFSKGNLLFLQYTGQQNLIKNTYGIDEPILDVTKVCPVAKLDIVFMPLVAFDEQGNRLGMGGGYYDRSLAFTCQVATKLSKPRLIGLAHECQKVDQLAKESWDIPIAEIMSPNKHYQFT
jgi:5-formyltetrahydrofolate cyclo-ligase